MTLARSPSRAAGRLVGAPDGSRIAGVGRMGLAYTVLATDYDGTLAEDGRVSDETLAALARAKGAGLTLVLVTGRELDELLGVFPGIGVFDRVVAENGALVYTPSTGAERLLSSAPPPTFAETLKSRGCERVSRGRVIVATWEPWQDVVLETIREMGLELEVIFNKGAVMVLPSGTNKASGLRAALLDLDVDAMKAVGIGDGENDHSLLAACGLGVAVANSVPALKQRAEVVTVAPRGAGVREILERMASDGLAQVRRAPREVTTKVEVVAAPEAG